MRGSCQNPQASFVIQHGLHGSSSPLELGVVPPPVACLFADCAWTRGFFAALLGPVAGWLTFEGFPLAGFTSRQVAKLFGPLRLSRGCQAWLTAMCTSLASALACLFSCQFLSSSSAWAQILNTPKATSKSWITGVCAPDCNFWSCQHVSGQTGWSNVGTAGTDPWEWRGQC